MNKYRLSPRARADLREILRYIVERWGKERARRYQYELRQAIERVAADPRLGRPCEDLRPGYLRYLAGTHMVFFRIGENGIDVIRILHQNMDYPRHL